MERIEYSGWPDCVRLSNPKIDLVVTTVIGPRIIRLGFVGERNEFWENPEDQGQRGGDEWRLYGGHRLWHAPEAMPRCYYPDNEPVHVDPLQGGVRLIQPTEPTTGIRKELDIRISPKEAYVQVVHRLRNDGLWPVELGAWALSVMAPGGQAVIPMPTRSHPDGLLPNRTLTLWPYTDMTDPRVTWGSRYIILRHSENAESAFKLGASVKDGWAAYVRDDVCFLKTFEYFEDAVYPDGGCSIESYTNSDPNMLELETLSPLAMLEPGDELEHLEHWFLHKGVSPAGGEAWVTEQIVPLAEQAEGTGPDWPNF
jgi:hypothetical protein